MAADSPSIVVASPRRVACEHAALCAGCPLIERTYDEQLTIKHDRVASSFAHFAQRISIDAVAPADPIVGYRSRAKLIVSDGKIGLFAKGGDHRVVDIQIGRAHV